MKTLVCLTAFLLAGALMAQTPAVASAPSSIEAQTIVDALAQSNDHVWSLYLLGMAQLVVALATLALLFNLRSLAFVFLILYGTVVLSVPFYIPTAFQNAFGFAIILMAFVGLISRLLMVKRKARSSEDNTPDSKA